MGAEPSPNRRKEDNNGNPHTVDHLESLLFLKRKLLNNLVLCYKIIIIIVRAVSAKEFPVTKSKRIGQLLGWKLGFVYSCAAYLAY